jgi:hypothetical protein
MQKIRLSFKTDFGEIEISGKDPQEVLEALERIDQKFVGEINKKIAGFITSQTDKKLEGILNIGKEGPVIVTKKKLSHYEAIGLILYASKDNLASSKQLRELLTASGKKVTVPARINEMRKRGHIFKPNSKSSEYKLSTRGIKWIEDDLLPKLFEKEK